MQRPAADRWCQDRDRSADQLRCCRGRSATARVAAADGRRRFGSLWASLVMLRLAGLGRVAGVAGHSDRMCSRRSTLMTALERFDLGLLCEENHAQKHNDIFNWQRERFILIRFLAERLEK